MVVLAQVLIVRIVDGPSYALLVNQYADCGGYADGSGNIAVKRTVLVMLAWPRKCTTSSSMPSPAKA